MRKLFLFFFFINIPAFLLPQNSVPRASESTINLARMFSKEIFVLNGVPYLQPLVESLNATSNSGFYNSAYVPHSVNKLYFKISVNGMVGFVPEEKKTYHPKLPTAQLDFNELSKYVELTVYPSPAIKSIKDTAGLLMYAIKVYLGRGVATGSIVPPGTSPTILGYGKSVFIIPRTVLDSLVRTYPTIGNKPLFEYFSDSLKATLLKTVNQFPEYYTLPEGANLTRLIIGVPQLEIGSFYGTELLLRFIPPINWGPTIGNFAFWGVGVKHSLSQYLPDRWFDAAVQAVYQGTYLKNEIGVTKANIKANANIWSFNLHLGKEFEWTNEKGETTGSLGIFTGFSYDRININTNYKFLLPVEVQYQLGMLEREQIGTDSNGNPIWGIKAPSKDFPGDTQIQNLDLDLHDSQYKATIGISGKIDMFRLYVQYNFSKFKVLTGGLEITF